RDELYRAPLHPYTEALLAAVPVADPEVEANRPRAIIRGEVPSALNPPSGCRFHPRCPRAMEVCRSIDPQLTDLGSDRAVACHLPGAEVERASAAASARTMLCADATSSWSICSPGPSFRSSPE